MKALRLAHQFFHFHLAQWHALAPAPSWKEVRALFEGEIFPRRALKIGVRLSFEEAQREAEKIMEWERRAGVRSIPVDSPAYPSSVLQYLPPERRPVFLHLRGADLPEENQGIAVVGTRFPSELGQDAARSFGAYFSTLGLKVISGLAKGIDAAAQRENLLQGTVGVLGSGVQDIYPAENQRLAEEILEKGGTLVSPFPLGQVPLPLNFPQRNELIAAMAVGTVVIEGAESSGAAVTGKLALGMGKCVAVLAQDYRSRFGRGAIRLHQAGANFVANEEEALQSIFFRVGGYGSPLPSPNPRSRRCFSLADFHASTKLNLPESLVLLEEGISGGQIERLGADRYRLKPRNAKR